MKTHKIFFVFVLLTFFSCTPRTHNNNSPFLSDNTIEAQPEKAKQYVFGSDDIPLFNGLQLLEDDSSSFDTTMGSIVISKYLGDFRADMVKDFYLKTLPQLGWKKVVNRANDISFKRGDDKLEIKFGYASKGLYVRFFLSSVLK